MRHHRQGQIVPINRSDKQSRFRSAINSKINDRIPIYLREELMMQVASSGNNPREKDLIKERWQGEGGFGWRGSA